MENCFVCGKPGATEFVGFEECRSYVGAWLTRIEKRLLLVCATHLQTTPTRSSCSRFRGHSNQSPGTTS